MLQITPDVNTLVEGTISRTGPAGEILAAWRAGQIVLVTCEQILAQYEEVLGRPHIRSAYRHITAKTIAASGAALRRYGTTVALAEIPAVVVDDPDDDVVLACAVRGEADYIVSRDRHLRDLGVHQGIPIVPPERLLPILRGRVREEAATYDPAGVSSAGVR